MDNNNSKSITKGKPGTFYAYVWEKTSGADNLYRPFSFSLNHRETPYEGCIITDGIEATAKKMKDYFDTLPDGKCAINPTNTLRYLFENQENLYWYDKGLAKHNTVMSELLECYKRLGGKNVDEVTCDMESYCSVWNAEGVSKDRNISMDEVYYEVERDPRYPALKRELKKYGFTFYEGDDHSELYYMFAHANDTPPNSPEKKDVYNAIRCSSEWVNRRYLDKIYELYDEYFPGIKFSQYGCRESDDPRYSTGAYGHIYGFFSEPTPIDERKHTYVGTHSSWENYGDIRPSFITAPPPGYPYAKYHTTPYNSILFHVIAMQNCLMYMPDSKMQPWMSCFSFCYAMATADAVTDYYNELVYHFGLGNPDPFLFYNWEDGQHGLKDNLIFSELLHDLDDLIGFEDRRSLINKRTSFASRYILNGMYAGGKNVWRITPDLSTDDVTIESFKVSDSPLTFRIGQQVVRFPEGSFIYEPDSEGRLVPYSSAGYWVITPEGTEPEEYIDEAYPKASEPDYMFGGKEELLKRVEEFKKANPNATV